MPFKHYKGILLNTVEEPRTNFSFSHGTMGSLTITYLQSIWSASNRCRRMRMVELTESARAQLQKYLKDKKYSAIRIYLASGG